MRRLSALCMCLALLLASCHEHDWVRTSKECWIEDGHITTCEFRCRFCGKVTNEPEND